MKPSMFANILLSALFYTTLLSTLFVMPLVLAAREDAGRTAEFQAWERALDAHARAEQRGSIRLPQTDLPMPGAASRRAPIGKSGPDAAMIKPVKARAKTIKL